MLTKRMIQPFEGLWHFAGGRVGYRESLHQALTRIAKAELGITLKDTHMLGYMEFLRDGRFVHSISIAFLARIKAGQLQGSAQAREIRIFKRIPPQTHPHHKKFLQKNWKEIKKLFA